MYRKVLDNGERKKTQQSFVTSTRKIVDNGSCQNITAGSPMLFLSSQWTSALKIVYNNI